ncbi:hypothetical protein SLA2020_144470 [Shorea laevis]
MIPPSPNQARRKALPFLLCSSNLTSSSLLKKAGFSTGDRLIIDALSLLLFCFFVDFPGGEWVEENDSNPCPGASPFLGGGASSRLGIDDGLLGFNSESGFGKDEEGRVWKMAMIGFMGERGWSVDL